jgi:hypothetical protein
MAWLVETRVSFSMFCAVGGLAVIHKKNEPNLARGVSKESKFFLESCFVLAIV